MPTIELAQRTTGDLFEYMSRNSVNEERSHEWAITSFVLKDGEPLTLEECIKLKSEWKDKFIGSLFSMKSGDDYDVLEDGSISYQSYLIPRREIKGSLLTQLQTAFQSEKRAVKAVKRGVLLMFDVKQDELEKLPSELGTILINEMKFFLNQSTEFARADDVAESELFVP